MSAVSSEMSEAEVNEEKTSRVTMIFCWFRRITSAANCSPGAVGVGLEVCTNISFGRWTKELQWAQLLTMD